MYTEYPNKLIGDSCENIIVLVLTIILENYLLVIATTEDIFMFFLFISYNRRNIESIYTIHFLNLFYPGNSNSS